MGCWDLQQQGMQGKGENPIKLTILVSKGGKAPEMSRFPKPDLPGPVHPYGDYLEISTTVSNGTYFQVNAHAMNHAFLLICTSLAVR